MPHIALQNHIARVRRLTRPPAVVLAVAVPLAGMLVWLACEQQRDLGIALGVCVVALMMAFGTTWKVMHQRVATELAGIERAEGQLLALQRAVACLPDAVVVCERSGPSQSAILYANPAFERLTGYRLGEALERSPAELLQGPRTCPITTAAIGEALRKGESFSGSLQLYRNDGEPIWTDLEFHPVLGAEGRLMQWIAVARPAGGREEQEQRLAEREQALRDYGESLLRSERYRELADKSGDVVWRINPAGEVTYANAAWYALTGLPQATDGPYEDWRVRVHPDDLVAMRSAWREARVLKQPFSGFRRLRVHDGTWRTLHYRVAPVFDAQGEVEAWLGTDTDVTPHKGIENQLRAANEELEAFSYSVSHDLRAPLGAIQGFAEALAARTQGQLDERGQHALSRIQANVAKAHQLIDALLALARYSRTPLQWERVNLSQIARETLDGLRAQQPARQVRLLVEEGIDVMGDARLLRVVLENLLGNAWKFTARVPVARIEFGCTPSGECFVRDNGAGFDMAYADKLFGAFQRLHTEAEFTGSGVGLATVRRIIHRHMGEVRAESRLGQGATFYFRMGIASTMVPEPLGALAERTDRAPAEVAVKPD